VARRFPLTERYNTTFEEDHQRRLVRRSQDGDVPERGVIDSPAHESEKDV